MGLDTSRQPQGPDQWRGGSESIVGGGVSRLLTSDIPVCIKRLCSNFRSNHSIGATSFQKSVGPNSAQRGRNTGGLEQGTGPLLFLGFWLFLVVLLFFVVVLYLGVLWGTRCSARCRCRCRCRRRRQDWGRRAINEAVLSRNLADHRSQIGAYRRPRYVIRPPERLYWIIRWSLCLRLPRHWIS
jgi:hypothetical protein